MGEASIPVDLVNPGQVFACLGFVEAADVLLGGARGGFDWQHGEDVRFRLESARAENPIAHVLRFLEEAEVVALEPYGCGYDGSSKWKIDIEKWNINIDPSQPYGFPCKPSKKLDTLPACLRDSDGNKIVIDHWGDDLRKTGRDNIKFWAGMGGKPGTKLALEALDLARDQITDHIGDPFSLTAEQSSSFRFDWRRDYVPIDSGFSLNPHGHMTTQGYPVVELMAAIGVTHARPMRRDKLNYSYGVAGASGADLYDPIFLRAALGARQPPFHGMPFRRFSMRLDWPGQENQARCITNVIEETSTS